PEALQARGGENDGVVVARTQPLDARRHVAAQLERHGIRARPGEKGAASQAAGADTRAARELTERRAVSPVQRLARNLPRARADAPWPRRAHGSPSVRKR